MDEHELSRVITVEVTLRNMEDDMRCLNKKMVDLDQRLDMIEKHLSGWRGGIAALIGFAMLVGLTFASIVTYFKGL